MDPKGERTMASTDQPRAHRPRSRHRQEATDVRQGEIILTTPLRRAVFLGGLAGIVLLPLLPWLLAG